MDPQQVIDRLDKVHEMFPGIESLGYTSVKELVTDETLIVDDMKFVMKFFDDKTVFRMSSKEFSVKISMKLGVSLNLTKMKEYKSYDKMTLYSVFMKFLGRGEGRIIITDNRPNKTRTIIMDTKQGLSINKSMTVNQIKRNIVESGHYPVKKRRTE